MKYGRNETIEVVDLGEELGMLNVDTGTYYILDCVSKDIWLLLENDLSVDDLVSESTKIYDVDYNVCKSDILGLVEELKCKGLIKEKK